MRLQRLEENIFIPNILSLNIDSVNKFIHV